MSNIKFVCRFARRMAREFKGSKAKYPWNEWQILEFEGEKVFEWNFGLSSKLEHFRFGVWQDLPEDWTDEDSVNFTRVLSAMA